MLGLSSVSVSLSLHRRISISLLRSNLHRSSFNRFGFPHFLSQISVDLHLHASNEGYRLLPSIDVVSEHSDLHRRYERWNHVQTTSRVFWGMGIGSVVESGGALSWGRKLLVMLVLVCGVGFNVETTLADFSIGLPANCLFKIYGTNEFHTCGSLCSKDSAC